MERQSERREKERERKEKKMRKRDERKMRERATREEKKLSQDISHSCGDLCTYTQTITRNNVKMKKPTVNNNKTISIHTR